MTIPHNFFYVWRKQKWNFSIITATSFVGVFTSRYEYNNRLLGGSFIWIRICKLLDFKKYCFPTLSTKFCYYLISTSTFASLRFWNSNLDEARIRVTFAHFWVPNIDETSAGYIYELIMVNQSHYRREQAPRVPGGWSSQISRQSAHEGGKVVSPTHRPPLSPGNNPGTHFCERLSQPQGHSAAGRIMSIKNP